jgi:TolB-like protein
MKKFYGYFVMIGIYCLITLLSPYAFAASNLEEGIKELAQHISKNMSETGKKKIAVVEFSDLNGNIRALGQFLAEELITELFLISPGKFEVVERRQLMKVLSEQKLTMSGLLDSKAMESVGKILGIDAIVTGSITDLGNDIKANARMIGVDTARVFAVARTSIPKIGIVATMWEEIIMPEPIIPTDPQPTTTLSPTSVYTNKNSRTFHRYDCPELKTEGLIEFKSPQRAIQAGGKACRRCNPSQTVKGGGQDPTGAITSTPSFQNDFLRVTLQSVSKSTANRRRGGSRVNLVFTLENISNEDIFIALQERNSVSLVGNQGTKWYLDDFKGINVADSYGREYLKESSSVFNPGAKNTIVMVFVSWEESEETVFSFSANMFSFVDKTATRFSIGLRDMSITQ